MGGDVRVELRQAEAQRAGRFKNLHRDQRRVVAVLRRGRDGDDLSDDILDSDDFDGAASHVLTRTIPEHAVRARRQASPAYVVLDAVEGRDLLSFEPQRT